LVAKRLIEAIIATTPAVYGPEKLVPSMSR